MFKNDLKKSSLIRQHLGDEGYHKLLTDWYSLMAQVAIEYGGEVLYDHGDSLAVFFDDEQEGRDSLGNALAATEAMLSVHSNLEEKYRLPVSLAFHASITRGTLLSKWKPVGGELLAGYGGYLINHNNNHNMNGVILLDI